MNHCTANVRESGESARAWSNTEDSGIRTASSQAYRPESRRYFERTRECSDESILPEVTIDGGTNELSNAGGDAAPKTGDVAPKTDNFNDAMHRNRELERQQEFQREQEFQRMMQELEQLWRQVWQMFQSIMQRYNCQYMPTPPVESPIPRPDQPAPPPEQPTPPPEQPTPPPEHPAPPPEQPAPPPEQPTPPPEQPALPGDRPTPPGDQPGDPPTPSSSGAKLIHIFPETQSDWNRIIADSPRGSLIVPLSSGDISWDSDHPFNSVDPALRRNIADASAAGLNPIGYVGTLGGTKPIEEVKAQIDSWYQHTDVRGIYLGNSGDHESGGGYATDSATEAYFEEIAGYIKSRYGGLAVINGGGTPNPDYMDSFDVQGTFEQEASQYRNQAADWQYNYSPDRFSAVIVDVSEDDIGRYENMAIANHNGYIAVAPSWRQSGWDDDSYWNRLLDGLDGRMDGRRPT